MFKLWTRIFLLLFSVFYLFIAIGTAAEAAGTINVSTKEVYPGSDVDLGVVTLELPPGALNTGDTFVLSLPEKLSFNTNLPVSIKSRGDLTSSTVNIVYPPSYNGKTNAITGNLTANYVGSRDLMVSATARPNTTENAFLHIYLMGVKIADDYNGIISITLESNRGWPNAVWEAPVKAAVIPKTSDPPATASTVTPPVSDPVSINARFKIGEASYILKGSPIAMDVAPFIKDGRTYVPIRYMAIAAGIPEESISFKEDEIRIKKGNVSVVITTGSNIILLDGASLKMDVPVVVVDGRTFCPLRWVCEAFDLKVIWNEKDQSILVQSKDK